MRTIKLTVKIIKMSAIQVW